MSGHKSIIKIITWAKIRRSGYIREEGFCKQGKSIYNKNSDMRDFMVHPMYHKMMLWLQKEELEKSTEKEPVKID